MKCLYCGKRLGMFKKAADEQFCSPAHRRLYAEEQERNTLAKLAAAQKRYEAVLGMGAPDLAAADLQKVKENKKKAPSNGNANGTGHLANGHTPQSETWNLVAIRALLPLTGPVRAKAALGPGDPVLPPPPLQKPEFETRQSRQTRGLMLTGLQPILVEPGDIATAPGTQSIQNESPVSLVPSLPHLHSRGVATGLLGAGLQPLIPTLFSQSFSQDTKSPSPLPGTNPAPNLPSLCLAAQPAWAPRGLLRGTEIRQPAGEKPISCGVIDPPFLPAARLPVIPAGNPRQPQAAAVFGRPDPIRDIIRQLESPQAGLAGQVSITQPPVLASFQPWQSPGGSEVLSYWQPSPLTPHSKGTGIPGRSEETGKTPWSFCPELLPLDPLAREGAAALYPVVPELLSGPLEARPVIPCLSRNSALTGLSPVENGLPLPEPVPVRLAFVPAPFTSGAERPKPVALAAVDADHRGDEEVRLADAGFEFGEPRLDLLSRQLKLTGAAVRPESTKPVHVAGSFVHLVSNPKELQALMAYPSSIALTGVSPRLVQALKRLELADLMPWEARAWKQRDLLALAWEVRPWIPKLKFRIIEDKGTPLGPELGSAVGGTTAAGSFLAQLWKTGPSDLKWVMMSVPVILGLMVYSLWPHGKTQTAPAFGGAPAVAVNRGGEPATGSSTVPATADPGAMPGGSNPQPEPPSPSPSAAAPLAVAVMPARAETGTFWTNVKQSIMRRAAIELSDDFRAGLGDWDGNANWASTWSYDPAGFVRPGTLALYRPTVGLTDYRIEFLAQIEKKSLGWVFRATDTNNYYAMKLTIQKPGPLPTVVVERYAVVHGREEVHRVSPLPLQLRTDSIYRVRVDIRGSEFTTQVQGQLADYWSDDRLRSGGVGFFSGRGEQSRVRWVEVQHQYDALGRLCAFLAPYSLPSTRDGSWKQ